MKEKIGTNAGLVWNALYDGSLDVKTLKKAVKLSEKDLFAAIGWLAREEKIFFVENDTDVVIGLI